MGICKVYTVGQTVVRVGNNTIANKHCHRTNLCLVLRLEACFCPVRTRPSRSPLPPSERLPI